MTSTVIWMINFLVCVHNADQANSLCTQKENVSFNKSTIEHDGKCYTVNLKRLSWHAAKDHCKSHGGGLAMINEILLGNESDFRQVFGEIYPYGCSWLGLSDEYTEGDWVWTDGSSVKWEFENPTWKEFVFPGMDCGRLCRFYSVPEYVWGMMSCHIPSYFICQYDSKVLLRSRPEKPKTKRRKISRIVRPSFLIKDEPLFEKKTYATAMCARFCQDPCQVFNYNIQSGQCRGFVANKHKLEGEKNAVWEAWEVTMI